MTVPKTFDNLFSSRPKGLSRLLRATFSAGTTAVFVTAGCKCRADITKGVVSLLVLAVVDSVVMGLRRKKFARLVESLAYKRRCESAGKRRRNVACRSKSISAM